MIPILGVNSNLKNGLHIPMLEFDDVNLRCLFAEIKNLQDRFRLGQAVIVSTGRFDSYHVFFKNQVTWKNAIKICAESELYDLKHLQFSLKRGHFTLRLSSKGGRKNELVDIIESDYASNCEFSDFDSFVLYETAVRIG